ncbi:MAG TPA: Fic family protein, partial [Longimicrobiaceae bacterium]|nr:Fic family protein [Longimicrobiaceae bacterium]
ESPPRIDAPGPDIAAQPAPGDETGAIAAPPEAEGELIPLSPAGEEIRAAVRQHISQRTAVGYDPEFLERYRPGETWYLPEATRARLHELGRTPAAERPAGTYAREIYERLLLDLSWASSRLEGNTYTRLDTLELLRYGREAEGRDIVETQMILNHRAAIELLVEEAEDVGFNRRTFFALHAALSENLLSNPRDEGRLRTSLVGIGGATFTPLAIPQKIEEQFDLLLRKADAIPDPFEQAFFVMVHLPYLQPFIDVNKRTSRLGANLPLIKANLCPLSFVDVPEREYVEGTLGVYELNRVELLRDVFVWAYERSCARYTAVRETVGRPDPFRLKYRLQIRALVREMVQALTLPEPSAIAGWGVEHGVEPEETDEFVQAARTELHALHEGSLMRYGLRPSELEAWERAVKQG